MKKNNTAMFQSLSTWDEHNDRKQTDCGSLVPGILQIPVPSTSPESETSDVGITINFNNVTRGMWLVAILRLSCIQLILVTTKKIISAIHTGASYDTSPCSWKLQQPIMVQGVLTKFSDLPKAG